MKKKYPFFCVLFLLITQYAISQTVYNISDPEELSNLVLNAGDQVILADGTYSSDERIDFLGSGTLQNPIVFRPATSGGVIFTGGLQMDIAGDYLVVDGFYWNGGLGASNFIQFRKGTAYAQHCTIQNCAINGLIADPDDAAEALAEGAIIKHRWIVLYGNYNSVLNCTFMNKNTAGALVLAEYEYNASPDEVANTRCEEVGHIISKNYFYNYEKQDANLSNAGDSETIRIGTSEFQNVNSGALVSGNYFVQADGENEIITNKSMNNTYVNNTFRRCRGSLVMRHGSDATVTGNYFLGENVQGTGGIRIADSNHQITNNYIQDCISSVDQIPWNNGLTFVGGNTNSVQNCLSTSVSNDYQDVVNINFSNNTFINTHSPFYFNATRDGADDVFGDVSNNLIYFESNNPNITNVINGSYNEVGSQLTFLGNVYDGATGLGGTANGFSEESISVTVNGEIFSHNQTGKGASISNAPITNSMVGNGVGACFLDSEANVISNPDCEIEDVEPIDSLSVSSLPVFSSDSEEATTNLTSNVSWIAESNDSWITINTESGTGNATILVFVSENEEADERTGSVTFTQVGGSLSRVLTVTQNAFDIVSTLNLINTGTNGNPVSVHSFSKEQVDLSNPDNKKENYAINSLDKSIGTFWVADDQQTDGEYVIYDLGSQYELDLIEIATNSKSDAYGFQIFVSTTGTASGDFEKVLPTSGDYLFTAVNSTDFNQYFLDGINAKYVKVIGFGRFNSDGVKTSPWSTIAEVNFYGESNSLSVNDIPSVEDLGIKLYPNPAKELLNVTGESFMFNRIKVYSAIGKEVFTIDLKPTNSLLKINLPNLSTGLYFIEISDGSKKAVSKIIISE